MADRWRAEGARDDCLAYDGEAHRLVCPDDQCHGADPTLCGLRWGEDYDEDEVGGEGE